MKYSSCTIQFSLQFHRIFYSDNITSFLELNFDQEVLNEKQIVF